ncbi:MAG: T9SS type A sorting domain-containing protein [Bacteroidales bacterium]
MKKILFSFFILLLGSSLFAQNTVLLREGFDTGKFPPDWTTDRKTNWGSNAGNNAGGQKPEMVFAYITQEGFNTPLLGRSLVSMPFLPCKTLENLLFSFKYSFRSSAASTNKTYGILARTNTNDPWKIVWSVENAPQMMDGAIATIELGSTYKNFDSIQFAIFIESSTTDQTQFMLCFDDIFVGNIQQVIGEVELPASPWFGMDLSMPIYGRFINKGLSAKSFTISYSVDDSEVKSSNFDQIVKTNQSFDFLCRPEWTTKPGSQMVKVWVSAINGTPLSLSQATDTAMKEIYITQESVKSRPLFEEFSSASCSPCAAMNQSVINPFNDTYGSRFSLIKYQVNIPGRDLYATAEGEKRSFFYNIHGVPSLFINSETTNITTANLLKSLQEQEKEESFFDIQIDTFMVDNKGIAKISYSILPKVNAKGLLVHTVLVEKETFKNKGSNGETSFHNVMMKMLPNADGNAVPFLANTKKSFSFIQNTKSTHTEEYKDLRLIVFIQDPYTKKVFQTAEKEVDTLRGTSIEKETFSPITIYPNPANNFINFYLDADANMSIYDLLGHLMERKELKAGLQTINVEHFPCGNYILHLQNSRGTRESKLVIYRF